MIVKIIIYIKNRPGAETVQTEEEKQETRMQALEELKSITEPPKVL